jgi:hypothetical protein
VPHVRHSVHGPKMMGAAQRSLSLSSSNDWNPPILKISASPVHTRHRGFDLLRVIAIYMVMQIHTGEFEYI